MSIMSKCRGNEATAAFFFETHEASTVSGATKKAYLRAFTNFHPTPKHTRPHTAPVGRD